MAILEKLSKIQTAIKAPKSLYNKFGNYHYRNAEGICEAVKPFLAQYDCSLVIRDEIVCIADRIYVKATATLYNNEDARYVSVEAYAREPADKKGMDASQVTGATSSYARKYALNGLFLLDDTKDPDTDEYKEESDARAYKEAETAKKTDAKKTASKKTATKPQTKPQEPKEKEPKTEDEFNPERPVTEREVELIRQCIASKGVTEEQVLKLYKKNSLNEFTAKHYANLMENLDKLKAAVS